MEIPTTRSASFSEQDTRSPSLLPSTEGGELEALAERLAGEMAAAWQRGQRLRVEDVLRRDPQARDNSQVAIRLIHEEVCLREEAGEEVPTCELRERFPQWCDQLDILLHCHHLIAPERAGPDFPDVGETLGGFRLLSELGRGGAGRVYLASQPLLSGRLVVLKVTPPGGAEPRRLSALQHTHIVPVYSVQEDHRRGVQAYCMPYLGGATLAQLLERLRETPPAARRGADLLRALDQGRAAPGESSPARRFLAGADYEQAVCWIGACLAEALQHVHDRGLLHLDVKPSNILIAADGQPMLFDFHLALPPLRVGQLAPRSFGGTPGYLAPEHAASMSAAASRQPFPSDLDGRADVYSLGVVLYEALGGKRPDRKSPVRLRRLNPRISRSLAAVVEKCLAADPARRYPTAAALAGDIRRHLRHEPLRGVPDRHPAERWRKWRRRHPAGLALLSVVLLALLAAGSAGVVGWQAVRGRIELAQAALIDAPRQRAQGDHASARRTLQRGQQALHAIPFSGDLQRRFSEERQRTDAAESVETLRRLVDQLRLLPDVIDPAGDHSSQLRQACAALWQQREYIVRSAAALPEPDAAAVTDDLRDFGILWAALRAQAEPGAAGHRAALTILDETERIAGPSPVLLLERQAQAAALGERELARQAEAVATGYAPATAWEHCALGRWLLRTGKTSAALSHLERAAELQPDLLWAHHYRAECARRLGRLDEAAAAWTVCLALAPKRAEFYVLRGQVHAADGRPDAALRDYGRALERDPSLSAALQDRARLQIRRGDLDAAVTGLTAAVERAPSAELHYLLAVAHSERREKTAALEHVRRALRLAPQHEGAQRLYRQLRRSR